MRSLPVIVAIAAIAAAAYCATGSSQAAEDEKGTPRRSTEERPFGGPPPNRRSLNPKTDSSKCKTATGSCQLDNAKPVGTVCTCPSGKEPGKVE